MRIMFVAIPAYGHVFPLLPLMQAARAARHDVVLAAGPPLLDPLTPLGIAGVSVFPRGASISSAEQATLRGHPELLELPDEAKWQIGLHLFADTVLSFMRPLLDAACADWQPDLVLYESMAVAAPVVAAGRGIPAVALGITQWRWFPPIVHRTVADRWQLELTGSSLGERYVDPFPPSTWTADEAVPRVAVRTQGVDLPGAVVPAWTDPAHSRPRAFVTLGTVSFAAVDVIRAAVGALTRHGAEVVVAVGPDGDPSLLGDQPERVHVQRFVPLVETIDQVDVVVHHGGSGTLLGCWAAGKPQVVMPQGADQFDNATLLKQTAAGTVWMPGEPTHVLETAVGEALTPEVGTAARRLQAEIAATPAADAVLETLTTQVA